MCLCTVVLVATAYTHGTERGKAKNLSYKSFIRKARNHAVNAAREIRERAPCLTLKLPMPRGSGAPPEGGPNHLFPRGVHPSSRGEYLTHSPVAGSAALSAPGV
jgi:hypothetical protein